MGISGGRLGINIGSHPTWFMKQGYLSSYFSGIAAKRLSSVEANVLASHQHEFNGVEPLKRLFGPASGKRKFAARFVYLKDYQDEPVVADGTLTWYDARERHRTRTEHRLYFPTNDVSERAVPGDQLIIGLRPDGTVLILVAEDGSTIAAQLRWLFGLNDLADPGYCVRDSLDTDRDRLALASSIVLENIGVAIEEAPDDFLDELLRRFGGGFPTTLEFSSYARATLPDIHPADDVDGALVAWMEREELLFRSLERHLISDQLSKGFDDVDAFISFSLSVQNRRKSRVGFALENHLACALEGAGLRFSRAQTTENRSRPDFLFPGAEQYRDPGFDPDLLTVLGVKSTCKDRWRQVLAEADRVKEKHLLTLEPAISTNQTSEMRAKSLQLILPRSLHASFTDHQRKWLMDVQSFIALVRARQGLMSHRARS